MQITINVLSVKIPRSETTAHSLYSDQNQVMSEKVILFIQNYETDPPHLMARWLEELGFRTEIIRAFDLAPIPQTIAPNIAGVIALGGAMSALDDENFKWLAPEKTFLKNLVDQEIPVLGICLGSQLLADALGGVVSRLENNEIGIYPIEQVAADPIMNFAPGSISTQWHEDYVSVLPKGATLISKSKQCPTQIYRIGDLSYGIQCHPEADASIVALWENKPDSAFKGFDKSKVESSISEIVRGHEEELVHIWKPVIQNWGEAVLRQAKD